MKRNLIFSAILFFSTVLLADEPVQVRVTGDRVSLRAAPQINAVLLDRMMSGDLLELADNSNPDWVGVVPPKEVDCWVDNDYLKDGKVKPKKLNVRSGPSLNHSVVAVVERGTTLDVRGELAGWSRIAPPVGAVAWISRQFTEGVEAPAKPVEIVQVKPAAVPSPVEVTPAPPVEKTIVDSNVTVVTQTVEQPEVNDVMVAAASAFKIPETLKPDPSKEQGVEETFSGVLMPTESPLCRLVDASGTDITICYVRGNIEQMKEHVGKTLSIVGKTYWSLGLELPVVVPVQIKL